MTEYSTIAKMSLPAEKIMRCVGRWQRNSSPWAETREECGVDAAERGPELTPVHLLMDIIASIIA